MKMSDGQLIRIGLAATALALACAHEAPSAPAVPATSAAIAPTPSPIPPEGATPLRSLDDIPLGVYVPTVAGWTRSVILERQGDELVLTASRADGGHVLLYRLRPQPDGRFWIPENASVAWFTRQGQQVFLSFLACYMQGTYYRRLLPS